MSNVRDNHIHNFQERAKMYYKKLLYKYFDISSMNNVIPLIAVYIEI